MKYAVIYEKSKTGYSAYLPDLLGCVATGRTLDLTKRRIKTAIQMHVAAMQADGDPIPEPTTTGVDFIEVPDVTAWLESGRTTGNDRS